MFALIVLTFILAIGGLLLGWQAITAGTPLATGTAALNIGVLGVGLFLNPLQTVERDIVYRRWSDVIIASFYAQYADPETHLKDLRAASSLAAEQFAVLAATHGKVSAGSAEAIKSIVNAASEAQGEDGESEEEAGAPQVGR